MSTIMQGDRINRDYFPHREPVQRTYQYRYGYGAGDSENSDTTGQTNTSQEYVCDNGVGYGRGNNLYDSHGEGYDHDEH